MIWSFLRVIVEWNRSGQEVKGLPGSSAILILTERRLAAGFGPGEVVMNNCCCNGGTQPFAWPKPVKNRRSDLK